MVSSIFIGLSSLLKKIFYFLDCDFPLPILQMLFNYLYILKVCLTVNNCVEYFLSMELMNLGHFVIH